ncbi:MAG: hypothetical protein COW70_06435 [Hydrogenophilales bacterium CG18_big_fil_WC_8_21_14_2_50_58_12]|nr:MAG: hypothetical protein COW70_06435 [Hydrogenophilales bacterium CG18_big_fil_WC_8_21_14_2_50_58_12]
MQLFLTRKAVVHNMQDDVAALEGWLLALKAWGVIGNVQLKWDVPEMLDEDVVKKSHYQRFLYRVTWFEKLFGSWFKVAPECVEHLKASKVIGESKVAPLRVNAAKKPNSVPDARSKESRLEEYLAEGWLAETFALNKVGRQFPVGLFENTISQKTSIFAGGKSAIDLVGIEDKAKRLWVFELKAEGNESMGIISELFFYVLFMRDVILGAFELQDVEGDAEEGDAKKGRLTLGQQKRGEIKEIRGCLLAPKFHPLLDNNRVIDLLNTASWPGDFKIKFCAEKLPATLVARVTA